MIGQSSGGEPGVRRPALLAAALLLAGGHAAAQDAHHWSYGYGPIGQLTGGALAGGVSDLSAVYYNPAALALIDEPRFVIGLRSVELSRIEVPGAAGSGLDFDSTVFDVVPAMVAGRAGGGDGARDRFAYAFLSRHDTDWDLGYTRALVSAQPEAAAGFGRVRARLIEHWLGGTWARRLRPGLALGVSPFLAYRAQRSRRWLSLESVGAGGSSAAFVGRDNEYNHGRLLAKLGLAWRPGRWQLGLTATTPGLKLYDRGRVAFNASVSGTGLAPRLSASTQTALDATYRAPWSVAAGASRRGGGTAVHLTVEWFAQVPPYQILSPEDAPIAGSTETVPLAFAGAAAGVVNLAVGLEQRLSGRLTAYAGAVRNGSTWRPEAETLASWDLIEASAGLTLATGRARIAMGVAYAWGDGALPRTIAAPFDGAPSETSHASFGRWTFSAGASLNGR